VFGEVVVQDIIDTRDKSSKKHKDRGDKSDKPIAPFFGMFQYEYSPDEESERCQQLVRYAKHRPDCGYIPVINQVAP